MRFPVSWQRRHGAGSGTTFASDSVPTTTPPVATQDNAMSCRFFNIMGWPVQRVVVAWTAATATTALTGTLYVWEETLGAWLKCNASAVSIPKGTLTYFDVPTVSDPAPTKASLSGPNAGATGGALDFILILGATDDDLYSIAMAPDITTVGT